MIIIGKNTYVDEAQKVEHEKMVENLAKYFKAREHFIDFCMKTPEQVWEELKADGAKWGKMTFKQHWDDLHKEETIPKMFFRGFPEEWTIIQPIEFEKGVL
jgi:hypothetical protein